MEQGEDDPADDGEGEGKDEQVDERGVAHTVDLHHIPTQHGYQQQLSQRHTLHSIG